MNKYIKLDRIRLQCLRNERGLSQKAATLECMKQSIRISEATIKRAESGKPILYRTANEFAKFYNIPLIELIEIAHEKHSNSSNQLFGRASEVAQFQEIVKTSGSLKQGRLLCIRGVAGIGKSRLLTEFQGVSKGYGIAFLLLQVRAIQTSNELPVLTQLLYSILASLFPEIKFSNCESSELVHRCCEYFCLDSLEKIHLTKQLGLDTPNDLLDLDASISFTRRESEEHKLLVKILCKVYENSPCVIAFDDVQWADENLLLSLRAISSQIRNIPVVLIMCTRFESDPIDVVWRSCVLNTPVFTMDLSPLSVEEATFFVQQAGNIENDYLNQVVKLAEGNPLYLQQLLMNYPSRVGCFPGSLLESIQIRLQALDASSQALVKAASVIGLKCELNLVYFLINNIECNLTDLMSCLMLRVESPGCLVFYHELIRQGIYENIDQKEKMALHDKAAQWYQSREKRLYAKHLSLSNSYKAPNAFLDAAEELIEKHNYAAALTVIDNAILFSTTEHYALLYAKATILRCLDLPEQSLKYFSDAVSHARNVQQKTELNLEMAMLYLRLRRWNDAQRVLMLVQQCDLFSKKKRALHLQRQIDSLGETGSIQAQNVFDKNLLRKGYYIKDVFCSLGDEGESDLKVNDKKPVAKNTIQIGVLHSQTGNLKDLELGVIRTTLLAVGEINENGGILGRQIEPIVVDARSHGNGFLEGANYLINEVNVHTLFGCSTSSSRRIVKPMVEVEDSILIYPFQYEGIERSEHIFYVGPAPNQTALPAVEWLYKQQCRRFFLLGSDYVYPVVTNSLIREQLTQWSITENDEFYVPLGCTNFDKVISRIKKQQPDTILLTLVGLESNREFFCQLRQSSINLSKIKIMSLVLSENDLKEIPTENVVGTHTVFSYFQNLDNPINAQFVRRYKACYGVDHNIGGYMESAYVGVYLWAKAVQRANSLDRREVRKAMQGVAHFGPGGVACIDEGNSHTWRQAQIAKVGEDGEFHPLWHSDKPIKPEPFPMGASPSEWEARLKKLRKSRWQGKWEKSCSRRGQGCDCCLKNTIG